jgi:membrane protein implicated in regulation of membrane protease activity
MGLLLLLVIVVLLAAVGVLGFVVKIALGVALGLFLGVTLVAAIITWRVRRALFGSRSRWRRVRGSSRIEVLDRPDRPSYS